MPSDRTARPCRFFGPELVVIVHNFAHQLFDELLADQAQLGGTLVWRPSLRQRRYTRVIQVGSRLDRTAGCADTDNRVIDVLWKLVANCLSDFFVQFASETKTVAATFLPGRMLGFALNFVRSGSAQ